MLCRTGGGRNNARCSLKLCYLDLPLVGRCLTIFPPSCYRKDTEPYRSTVAQMAAHSPHDRKVVGSNPAGSYETVFLSESRIDALTRDNK